MLMYVVCVAVMWLLPLNEVLDWVLVSPLLPAVALMAYVKRFERGHSIAENPNWGA